MTSRTAAKEVARTISEKSVVPITLTLLIGLVSGVWLLAFKVAEFSNRLDSLEASVSARWTYHMDRESWGEFLRLNPGVKIPDISRIREIFGGTRP